MTAPPLHLSPRQVEVCILVAAGYSDKGVARELGISRAAVREYLRIASGRIRESCLHIRGAPREVVREWYTECRFQAYFANRSAA